MCLQDQLRDVRCMLDSIEKSQFFNLENRAVLNLPSMIRRQLVISPLRLVI